MSAKVHTADPGLARAVEKQLRRWEISCSQHPNNQRGGRIRIFDFVAISNAVGAGGDDIAAQLGERLGWPVFDKQILHTMAHDDEVRARLYASMDERDLGLFEEAFRAFMQQEFRRNDYFHQLTATILCIARQGPAIFLGRGADLILPQDRGIRVKLIASRQQRIENFAQRSGVTETQAAAAIDRIEKERRDFFRHHFHAANDDATRFDLLINMERFCPGEVVDLIEVALKQRTA